MNTRSFGNFAFVADEPWDYMKQDKTIIHLKRVGKKFGNVVALKDFNLTVEEGEFISLLGPSGCGKTTLLRIIAGQELSYIGQVFIRDKLMGRTPPFRRPVNMVFQRYALFPHMNVFNNIAFGLKIKKLPKDEIRRRVLDSLALVELEGFEGRHVTQLSGGQAQRVALARALVNHPEVLLLDEPLGALDLKIRKQMQLELKKIHNKLGTTFIYVTHDQEEALVMSDRIVVIEKGRIIQIGKPQDIYSFPNSVFSARFIGESNILEGKCAKTDGNYAFVNAYGIELKGRTLGTIASGSTVWISIRPEHLLLVSPKKEQIIKHSLAGTVRDSYFLGSLMKTEISINEKVTFTVQFNAPKQTHMLKPGDRVQVVWDPELITVLSK
jgi:spermidine/putrescine ABC transporter ATP-binding subunit